MIEFLKCRICGNVIVKMVDSGITPYCCGKEMLELKPNVVENVEESHVPYIQRMDYTTLKISIGQTPHPMTLEHHISFICIETAHGFVMRRLLPNKPAEVFFLISDDVIAVYAYCNRHGLWRLSAEGNEEEEDKYK